MDDTIKFHNKDRFKELGTIGLKETGGFVYEDPIKLLQGQRGLKIFKEMSENDDTVGACLLAIEMLMRQVPWNVQEASQDNNDMINAEFIKSCMEDMDHTWDDFISEVLSMLTYGFSWHEQVFKKRLGDSRNPIFKSEYNDGRIGWRRLPIRAQETLFSWEFNDQGDLLGFNQFDEYAGRNVTIPLEKSLHFVTRRRKNNPEGRVILRNAYRSWYFKKNIQNIEGIGIERDLAGLPVGYMPPEFMAENATPDQKATFKMMQKLITSIKRDEQEGVIMPLAYDDNGHKLFDLQLLNSGGSRQFDTSAIIRRYDESISMSILADFILLGHKNVGSYALAETKSDMFTMAIGAWADSICDVVNRFGIPKLMKLNNLKYDKMPKLTRGTIRSVSLKDLGEYISKLSGAGANLFPDERLENYLRKQADLPMSDTASEGI